MAIELKIVALQTDTYVSSFVVVLCNVSAWEVVGRYVYRPFCCVICLVGSLKGTHKICTSYILVCATSTCCEGVLGQVIELLRTLNLDVCDTRGPGVCTTQECVLTRSVHILTRDPLVSWTVL